MSQRSASKTSKAKATKGKAAATKAATKSKAPAKAAAKTQRAGKTASKSKNTSLSAFGHRFDARPDRLDFRDLVYEPPLRSLPAVFPTAAHLSEAVPSYVASNLVLDQGREGACTGFGLAAVVNYLLWLRELEQPGQHQPVRVSPHMFYELARRYDEWDGEDYEGSSCRGALKGFHKHGVCQEVYWPKSGAGARAETEWDVDALRRPLGVYYRIDKNSVVDMQAAIAQIGAIYVSAQVHNGWNTVPHSTHAPTSHDEAELPTIPERNRGELGGHAFALVGYNERGFIVQNSWGERWGAAGFAVMPYSDWVMYGTDAWALALGVPQRHDEASAARIAAQRWPQRSGRSVGYAGRPGKSPDNPLDDPWPIDREFDHKPYQPWSTARAYEHTLVTGNNGHVVITDFTAGVDGNVAAFVQAQVDRALVFFKTRPQAHLMVYAHGGLNSETEAIDRIRVLAPYFEANGIYPFFLTWRTGPLETLVHILEDRLREAFGVDDERARGILQRLGEARDRGVEAIASKAFKGLWGEMKQNARRGELKGRGSDQLARALASLAARQGQLGQPLQLHLVGHSAGAIVLGHLVDRLAAQAVQASSCSLYAPACTVDFANDKYLGVGANVITPDRLHLHYLTDRQEKDDDLAQVGPITLYGKSLLYLVSRALEDVRKMPLLGMERAHDPAHFNEDQWARSQLAALARWQAAFPAANRHPVPTPYIPVNKLGKTEQATHGSFDNNIDVIAETIRRIGGKAPVKPIEWLDY
ncbi:MAG TPA: C1 family peptidase [Hydrogenophaga sp.]|uniref:C1 family peptidase n=1 Tax=Hydrogenophaga sp. TaxID=1904254 RepID=UPI002D1B43A4|nr:C1 family peptidase [Hydrogenophaga sp.]HMN93851.1 C1 family peptidase [Hydrogenophaga sp.]HMP09866.1 C1 family peptidase [Hydrogenophaga sp.]